MLTLQVDRETAVSYYKFLAAVIVCPAQVLWMAHSEIGCQQDHINNNNNNNNNIEGSCTFYALLSEAASLIKFWD